MVRITRFLPFLTAVSLHLPLSYFFFYFVSNFLFPLLSGYPLFFLHTFLVPFFPSSRSSPLLIIFSFPSLSLSITTFLTIISLFATLSPYLPVSVSLSPCLSVSLLASLSPLLPACLLLCLPACLPLSPSAHCHHTPQSHVLKPHFLLPRLT